MLLAVENCGIRIGSCYVKRCLSLSKIINNRLDKSQEIELKPDDEFMDIRRDDAKMLKVAFLGAPNVGKSTIINQLTNRSICPISSKVHTTVHKADAIYVEGNTQLVFMDTPGLVAKHEMKRYMLPESFQTDPENSFSEADVVGIVQDVGNIYTRTKIHYCILNMLQTKNNDIPLLLIWNKVDTLKNKAMLLTLTRTLTKNTALPKFNDVFMVSALNGDGIDDLRNYLLDSAKPKDWQYNTDVYTNQMREKIIEETVRAKLLDILPNEVPYQLQVKLEYFGVCPDQSISSVVSITCPRSRFCKLLLSSKRNRIRTVAQLAEEDLRHAFRTAVFLKLSVLSVKKDD